MPDLDAKALAAELVNEVWLDESWDSEFMPSPHSPQAVLSKLVALGAAAVPVLIDLTRHGSSNVRWWACVGLAKTGHHDLVAALDALAGVAADPSVAVRAAEAIGQLDLDRFVDGGFHRVAGAVREVMKALQVRREAATLFERLLKNEEEAPLVAALGALTSLQGDQALRRCVTRALHSRHAAVREKAVWVLAQTAHDIEVEALIEAMATGGKVAMVERVAWHPNSAQVVRVIVSDGNTWLLMDLLMRRRCAGHETPLTRDLQRLLERKLRFPDRPYRYEQHDVYSAARCVLELGDVKLLPALVDAVDPANAGFAWTPLIRALRHFAERAIAALTTARATAPRARAERLQWAIGELSKPMHLTLEVADDSFVRGSIDHTTDCAFSGYADVLRQRPSAHAAFQLAWIDRAFGNAITTDRAEWIRSLGFTDDALLETLLTPVTGLEGLRLSWRKCDSPERIASALESGLPGLAFTGSGDATHRLLAAQHIERVKLACARST